MTYEAGLESSSRSGYASKVFPGKLCPWTMAGCLFLAAGCDKKPAETTSGFRPPETFEQREERLDATAWHDEVLAQRYEQGFVLLRDELIRSTNKLALLSNFEFESLVIPVSKNPPHSIGMGIQSQEFGDDRASNLNLQAWRENLARLGALGWKLVQAEWTHERFIPPAPGTNAISVFAFALDGERVKEGTRFTIRGLLRVEWAADNEPAKPVKAHRLLVSNVKILERMGPPGFRKQFVMTPDAPEAKGTFINLHPLIVTDFDADGYDDIILAGGNRFFRNKGGAQFEPMEFIAPEVFHGVRSVGLVADFNGDGLPDFLTVASEGVWSNHLVLYQGTGSVPFTNEPVMACPGLSLQEPSVLTAGDIDNDGDLDVWLAQYKPPYVDGQMPTPYYNANDGYRSLLLLNDGHGHFDDKTSSAGLAAKSHRRTYSASFADLNGDGNLDLITVNDFAGADIYYNDGRGVFTDETSRLYSSHLFGMSHCLADFDRDGVLDLFVAGMSLPTVRRLEALKAERPDFPDRTRQRVEMTYGNRLYVGRDGRWVQPRFGDEVASSGWTWGCTALDLANDGNLDLYLANGHISGESSQDYDSHYWRHDIYVGSSREDRRILYYFAQPFQGINTGKTSWNGYQHNVLFFDAGGNHYFDIAFLMDVAHESDCRAVVSADLDNDGRMDLLVTEAQWMGNSTTGRHRLLVHLNQVPSDGHWIGVKLISHKPGRSAIGAKVFARSPERSWMAQIVTGSSFQAQHPTTVHFGLGKVASLTELLVQWPNGETQTIQSPGLDRYHRF